MARSLRGERSFYRGAMGRVGAHDPGGGGVVSGCDCGGKALKNVEF